ncbi:MAG: pyridoxamine 5'-phosphate oxidase family protein [Acidobacteriaceae bacterium]
MSYPTNQAAANRFLIAMTESTGPVRKIAGLIKDIRIATLTTAAESGRLRSRPMATQDAEFEGTLWFLTYDDSPKTSEIGREHEVNVSYSDPEHQRYVSVSGKARISKDRKLIQELWKPVLKAWFPKGQDDPNIAVITIEAEEAEYWDSPSSAFVKVAGLAKALATGKPFFGGENKKVDFQTGEVVASKRVLEDRADKDSAA